MNRADEYAFFSEPVFDVLIRYQSLYMESSTNFLNHTHLNIKNYFILALLRWFPSTKYWLRAGRQKGRSSSSGRVKNFLSSMSSRPALWSTQPPLQWVPGALSSGVKRQGREAEHSSSTTAEVKKMWIYTSTPPHAFMA
jgi:hypothetical protein